MAVANIEIKNLDKLQNALQQYPATAKKYLQPAVAASAAEVQKNATRQNVPWRTGNLVQSFGNGITIGELYARISPTAFYAVFVHEGGKGRKGNPFMPRIAEKAQPQIQQHFEKALNNITEALAK